MFLRRILRYVSPISSVGRNIRVCRSISSSADATPFKGHALQIPPRTSDTNKTRASADATPCATTAQKRKVLAKLKSGEDCDLVLTEMEYQGVPIVLMLTDLCRWANLFKKQDKPQKALEIYAFMRRKGLLLTRNSLAVSMLSSHSDQDRASADATPCATTALKRKVLAKLKSCEDCDLVLTEMDNQGVPIILMQADLCRWVKLLEKQGKDQKSLEITHFMMKKSSSLYRENRNSSANAGLSGSRISPRKISPISSVRRKIRMGRSISVLSSADASPEYSDCLGRNSLSNAAAIIVPSVVKYEA